MIFPVDEKVSRMIPVPEAPVTTEDPWPPLEAHLAVRRDVPGGDGGGSGRACTFLVACSDSDIYPPFHSFPVPPDIRGALQMAIPSSIEVEAASPSAFTASVQIVQSCTVARTAQRSGLLIATERLCSMMSGRHERRDDHHGFGDRRIQ